MLLSACDTLSSQARLKGEINVASRKIAASIFNVTLQARIAALIPVAVLTAVLTTVPTAQAQTYTILHNFTNGSDGSFPQSGVTLDRAGNLYGTATGDGSQTMGTVYKMERAGSGWVFVPLYNFHGADGAAPFGPLTIARDGTLYGTTLAGGYHDGHCAAGGCGLVFQLRPPATAPRNALEPWSENVVFPFDDVDGNEPVYPQLIFDHAGNIYGTTQFGGPNDAGTVFELAPSQNGWTETVLYNGFNTLGTGSQPEAGVVMDSAGNLYGTTPTGGDEHGIVYELSPTANGYEQTVLHTFHVADGNLPYAGLVMDSVGNLYGASFAGGLDDCGNVYELSPSASGWTFNVIYNFVTCSGGPYQSLVFDSAGNLYGTANGDGAGNAGMVFKLTNSNGTWRLTDLHDFSFQSEYFPVGSVAIDANGNLYGTTSVGGQYGYGVVWEITP